jgi:hypothetical protein
MEPPSPVNLEKSDLSYTKFFKLLAQSQKWIQAVIQQKKKAKIPYFRDDGSISYS